jgi:hypothetical protein
MPVFIAEVSLAFKLSMRDKTKRAPAEGGGESRSNGR